MIEVGKYEGSKSLRVQLCNGEKEVGFRSASDKKLNTAYKPGCKKRVLDHWIRELKVIAEGKNHYRFGRS